MVIKRVFNNNALVVLDQNGEEMILTGKGIAFQKKAGDQVDESKIQKRFVFDKTELTEKFSQLFEQIPAQYLELTSAIIEMAEKELQVRLDSGIYIALADHIYYAIQRYQAKEYIKNALLFEIKKFYAKEFQAGLKALDMIYYETHISMSEDEAGFIAMHFVNAKQGGEEMNQTIHVTKMVEDILHIVEYHYQMKLDENSLNYTRFVTHICYFARRLLAKELNADTDDSLYEQIKEKYPNAYRCTLKVKKYVEQTCNIELTTEEMTYFMLHINRVCSRNKAIE